MHEACVGCGAVRVRDGDEAIAIGYDPATGLRIRMGEWEPEYGESLVREMRRLVPTVWPYRVTGGAAYGVSGGLVIGEMDKERMREFGRRSRKKLAKTKALGKVWRVAKEGARMGADAYTGGAYSRIEEAAREGIAKESLPGSATSKAANASLPPNKRTSDAQKIRELVPWGPLL